jgi:cytochrome P450
MGNGLASVAHQDHRRQRLVMQPAFRHEHLRGYIAVMRGTPVSLAARAVLVPRAFPVRLSARSAQAVTLRSLYWPEL